MVIEKIVKGDPFRGSLLFKEKNTENLTGNFYYHSKENSVAFVFEDYLFQMLAAATSQMVHPLSLIFNDSFEHFEW